jgi:hypothetical protein
MSLGLFIAFNFFIKEHAFVVLHRSRSIKSRMIKVGLTVLREFQNGA